MLLPALVGNLPLVVLLFFHAWFAAARLLGAADTCTPRAADRTPLVGAHAAAMLSGFLVPFLAIFRLAQGFVPRRPALPPGSPPRGAGRPCTLTRKGASK